jgi:transposase-like protein
MDAGKEPAAFPRVKPSWTGYWPPAPKVLMWPALPAVLKGALPATSKQPNHNAIITVDKNAAYPKPVAEMKKDGELWRCSRLRQVKYLNNIVEQDHRNVKRRTCPGLGFGSFWTALRTLAGYEAMAMIRKGQVRNINDNEIKAQAKFIAELFKIAA